MTEKTAIQIVKDFIDAWKTVNIDHIVSFLAEDVQYHNIPMEPLQGIAACRTFFQSMGEMEEAHWDLVNIAANGNIVMTERVDHFTISGKSVSLPLMGVFEIENGKIKAWRDYFDLASFTGQMS
jgi:limonene-1,2-epoxide hydrolase